MSQDSQTQAQEVLVLIMLTQILPAAEKKEKPLLPWNWDFLFTEKKRYHYFIFLSDLTVARG